MTSYMRNRLVFKVFHSSDEDAEDQLMAVYNTTYPGTSAEDLVDVRKSAAEAVSAAQERHAFFAISPAGNISLVSPNDVAAHWEDVEGGDAVLEILAERDRQIEKGYTPEHDDEHGGDHLLQIARGYLAVPEEVVGIPLAASVVRERVIKSIATSLALLEHLDRTSALEQG